MTDLDASTDGENVTEALLVGVTLCEVETDIVLVGDAATELVNVADGEAVAIQAVRMMLPSAPADPTAPPPTNVTAPMDAKGQVLLYAELPPPPPPPK